VSSRPERAIEYGQRAVELATVLDLPELRAHALNNMGAAQQGAPEAIALLEESIELSARLNSPEEARGHHNLGVCAYMVGDVPKALAEVEAGLASAQRFGLAPFVRFSRGQQPVYLYRVGRWDEALAIADQVGTGDLRQHETTSLTRAWIGALRDELSEALEEVERGLEGARRAGDPQGMYPALAVGAFVNAEAGHHDRAKELLQELSDKWSEREIAYGAPADMAITWFELLGKELWRKRYDTPDAPQVLWLRAARALVEEDWPLAIELYEASGAVTDVAAAQLYAAQKLLDAGRRAEAELYLQPALAFYRSVRATRRVRQGEALLAASA